MTLLRSLVSNFLLVALVLGQMSCASFERSSSSGYMDWREGDSAEVSVTEKGYNERVKYRSRRSDIERLESNLRTESEYEFYSQAKPALKTEKEKKEFLSQKGKESQKRWLASRGISETSLYDTNVRTAIDEGDVVLGMSKDAVLKSWGDPENIEVAGNPDFGSERWVYTHFEGSPEGYQKQERMIYFERGKVVGWETR